MVSADTTEAVKNHPTASPVGCMFETTLAGAPSIGLLPDDIIMLNIKPI